MCTVTTRNRHDTICTLRQPSTGQRATGGERIETEHTREQTRRVQCCLRKRKAYRVPGKQLDNGIDQPAAWPTVLGRDVRSAQTTSAAKRHNVVFRALCLLGDYISFEPFAQLSCLRYNYECSYPTELLRVDGYRDVFRISFCPPFVGPVDLKKCRGLLRAVRP